LILISDVHGCFNTLISLLKKCPKDDVCFVGDLVDRGPRSSEVVQYVIDNNFKTVLGNHEEMMANCSGRDFETWSYNGALQTLKSYKLGIQDSKFRDHKEWMRNLPLYLLFEDIVDANGNKLLVTHSSAAKVWPWGEEKRQQMSVSFKNHLIWERNYNPKKIEGVFNVFGHTPLQEPIIKEGFAFIDTGAVFNGVVDRGVPFVGRLTALRFPQMEVFQQDYID